MQALVYTPAMQGIGEFDGGKITEQKPIGFPGDGAVVKRVGPLFYWAWATTTDAEGFIGLHPHQAFEIMTYVVEGKAHHGYTLGTNSTVGAGGAQIMQTGTGVSHQEGISANAELFQIWFEPELNEAIKRKPTYRQHEHGEFPIERHAEGFQVKTVIGSNAPIKLVADIRMWDVEVISEAQYQHHISAGYTLTALAIRGQGTWSSSEQSRQPVQFQHKDFIIGAAQNQTMVDIVNTGEDLLRLILIEVPTEVNYPLYRKG